jgi:hypothetical protein
MHSVEKNALPLCPVAITLVHQNDSHKRIEVNVRIESRDDIFGTIEEKYPTLITASKIDTRAIISMTRIGLSIDMSQRMPDKSDKLKKFPETTLALHRNTSSTGEARIPKIHDITKKIRLISVVTSCLVSIPPRWEP